MTREAGDVVRVGDVAVHGVDVDPETRCAHYATERDVLAIAFACCGTFYPCFECHAALADHEAEVWPRDARDVEALRCGACGAAFAIETYLAAPSSCPACDAPFNPGCVDHHDRYFAV